MKQIVSILLALCWALAPALAQQSVFVPATTASVAVTISSATTTLLITGVSGKSIYVTGALIIADGTGSIQFKAGTGATCGTGTVNLTGNMALTAQQGFAMGVGNGTFWVAPQGFSVCATTNAAVGMPGSLSYAIF